MLEGKSVNLRVMEKEDLQILVEWLNDPEVLGEYNPLKKLPESKWRKQLRVGIPANKRHS